MLVSFLMSVSEKYRIEFRNDTESHLLVVKVTRGLLSKEVYVCCGPEYEEQPIVRAIQHSIKFLEDAYNGG